ncbi:MAG: hypothetical protein QXP04_00355 [Candidatus Nanoarchaeia archaeon]|nr:hypothetical protein [Candidatus Jingweiarchaeum tengchongense]
MSLVGFYTDEKGRRRPIFSRKGERWISLPKKVPAFRDARLSYIEVEDNRLTLHYMPDEEIIEVHTPKTSPHLEFWWDDGFELIVPSFHGYAYGKKGSEWYEIDLMEKKIIKRSDNPLTDKDFILSKVIPESQWGEWVKNVRVIFRNR